MLKIAISGKAKSGKNTVANIILKEICKNNRLQHEQLIAFADPIKEIVLQMFPTAKKECLYGPSEKRSEIISDNLFDSNGNLLTYRQALMDIGSMARKYNSNIWVEMFDKKFKKMSGDIIIATDLRFMEEFNYLKNNNFFLIKIKRDDITKIDHPSETTQDNIEICNFNYVLDNNGDLKNLEHTIKNNIIPLLFKSSI